MLLDSAIAGPVIPGLIAAALYLAGALLNGWALAHNAGKTSLRLLSALAAPAMTLHGFAVYAQIAAPEGISLGLLSVASLTALVMVVLVMLMSILQPVRSLLVVLFPISAAALDAKVKLRQYGQCRHFRPLHSVQIRSVVSPSRQSR